MTKMYSSTEKNILAAARKIFIEKGREGARMQEIADEAGINKALLHYYFRNKERLFQAVFLEVIDKFFPEVNALAGSEKSFFEVLRIFVDKYISLILENPHIPIFILHELNQKPGSIAKLLGTRMLMMDQLAGKIQKEIAAGIIRPVDPRQVMINTISLCIFPFVARPIVSQVFFEGNQSAYQDFLIQRKNEIYQFVVNSIKA